MLIRTLRQIAGNAAFILTSDVANRATTFLLYAMVARYRGPLEFGRMSLALTLFYTFQVLAVAGLKVLVTRQIARDRSQTSQYLVNGGLVVVITSLVSLGILRLLVRLMGYAPDTASAILLLALGLMPYALSAICEGVFQAWERMHHIAQVNVPVNLAKVGLAFWLLSRGYGLHHLILLFLTSHVAIAAIEWGLIVTRITRPQWKLDPRFSLAMVCSTSVFLGIDGLIAVTGSLTVLILSKVGGETQVGIYSAASQLLVPVTLVYTSVVLSVFPTMCRGFEHNPQSVRRISEKLIELLLVLALPTVVGLFCMAEPALGLLYGDHDFRLAASALRIMVWNLILIALTTVLGQVLVAGLREKVTLRIVAVDALTSLLFGWIFISRWGVVGAALTMVLMRSVDLLQHYAPVSRLLSRIALARSIWKPAAAGACMAGYLLAIKSQGFLLAAASASALYAMVFLVLVICSVGGPRQLKARYSDLWPK